MKHIDVPVKPCSWFEMISQIAKLRLDNKAVSCTYEDERRLRGIPNVLISELLIVTRIEVLHIQFCRRHFVVMCGCVYV